MTIQTIRIRTSAGDFRVRVDEFTERHDIDTRIARRLGYRAAWATNSSGSRGSYQVNLGHHIRGGGFAVERTITVYR